MKASGVHKIVIRHISGSKANQIEEFTLNGRTELRIGRDPSGDIVYDFATDDVVSRHHAVIGVSQNGRPTFTIQDLNSSNGTFLNGEQIREKAELLPDDALTFGRGGPSFAFDVQPRPPGVGPRTRIVDVATPAATRILDADEAATSASLRAATGTSVLVMTQDKGSAGKVGIGKETLLHELEKERSAANRTWLSVFAALVAAAVIGGGVLYWREIRGEQAQQRSLDEIKGEAERATEQNQEAEAQRAEGLKQRLGMNPQDIIRQYGSATAQLNVQWRLFDQATGRPIFLKTANYKDKTYGFYVKLPNGSIVPYLTLDDENRQNQSIGELFFGTAFVVSKQGFLLTATATPPLGARPFPSATALKRTDC